ncbi:MAG TPA: 1-(5-phosphoribosyl)-5-((5-phosphoribosylamino)methylideneamino)imidazole-4-carboxamide isomerase [Ferroplasma sp.]|nr:1-(5-phosphoribosyl)-5-((5-phosphoribosylamino)methylideneamino)imidazole-4-carboxamide isomerase [Ferroplasma sp.]
MIDIYPAIDIYNGEAVSLENGDIKRKESFGDPLKFAIDFSEISGNLHIVDLNGAFTGNTANRNAIKNIRENVKSFMQVGGGFRTMESIDSGYKMGVDSIIIGTASLDRKILEEAAEKYKNITISIDAYNGYIKYNGWANGTKITYRKFYGEVQDIANRFIFTSINSDGTGHMSTIEKFWEDGYFIYAGGVNSIEDLKKLENIGFNGAIIGKALYNGNIGMEELKCLQRE